LKKFFAIFLVITITAPFVGTYTWLQYKKYQVHEEIRLRIKAGVENRELNVFQFSKIETKSLLRWEHEKEFEYKGEMYDVVLSKEKGDSIIFFCLKDHKETSINQQIKLLVSIAIGQDQQQRENQKRLTWFSKSLYHALLFSWSLPHPNNHSKKGNTPYYSNYSSIHLPPPFPPPKML
jgi:hypothetical protein